jgi:hypothetical protein
MLSPVNAATIETQVRQLVATVSDEIGKMLQSQEHLAEVLRGNIDSLKKEAAAAQ